MIKNTKEDCSKVGCSCDYDWASISCDDGYYRSSHTDLDGHETYYCCNCPSICLRCSDSMTCITCISGYFILSNYCYKCNINCKTTLSDNCRCDTCNDGYYNNNYQCLACNSNCKTCSDSATKCLSCNKGYYLSSSNTCIK